MSIAIFSHTFTADVTSPTTLVVGTLPANSTIVDVICQSSNNDVSELGDFSVGHDGHGLIPADSAAFIASATMFLGGGPFRAPIDITAAPVCETVSSTLDITLSVTTQTTNANGTTINVIVYYI